MGLTKRSEVDEHGAPRYILEYDSDSMEFDQIVIQFDPDDEQRLYCRCYDEEDEAFTGAFVRRNLSFDPISYIGRGEASRLDGVEAVEDDRLPDDVMTAMQSIGMTVVPTGEWWL